MNAEKSLLGILFFEILYHTIKMRSDLFFPKYKLFIVRKILKLKVSVINM